MFALSRPSGDGGWAWVNSSGRSRSRRTRPARRKSPACEQGFVALERRLLRARLVLESREELARRDDLDAAVLAQLEEEPVDGDEVLGAGFDRALEVAVVAWVFRDDAEPELARCRDRDRGEVGDEGVDSTRSPAVAPHDPRVVENAAKLVEDRCGRRDDEARSSCQAESSAAGVP